MVIGGNEARPQYPQQLNMRCCVNDTGTSFASLIRVPFVVVGAFSGFILDCCGLDHGAHCLGPPSSTVFFRRTTRLHRPGCYELLLYEHHNEPDLCFRSKWCYSK